MGGPAAGTSSTIRKKKQRQSHHGLPDRGRAVSRNGGVSVVTTLGTLLKRRREAAPLQHPHAQAGTRPSATRERRPRARSRPWTTEWRSLRGGATRCVGQRAHAQATHRGDSSDDNQESEMHFSLDDAILPPAPCCLCWWLLWNFPAMVAGERTGSKRPLDSAALDLNDSVRARGGATAVRSRCFLRE